MIINYIGKTDEEKYKENKSPPNVIDLTPKFYQNFILQIVQKVN